MPRGDTHAKGVRLALEGGRRRWQVAVAVILLMGVVACSAKKGDSNRGGKSHLVTNSEWTRRHSKSSECRLGGVRYALNSTWSPDLGPPFGVWNCVKCTCTPVQKKRRIVAKVICRNFKSECPTEVKCDNPVLLPGECCKVCSGDGNGGGPSALGPNLLQEEEAETDALAEKDFAVLLNGRTSISPMTTRRLATGRIFLRRGTLHFSFIMDHNTPSPTTVQFLSEDGNILEELEAQPTPYEVNNGRICGTWTRVPRQYRNLLMKEKMWVSLLTSEDDDPISGRIARYKGVNTEVFSSLLSPIHDTKQKLPSGGTAIISVSALSDSLHISLVFNGIFRNSDERNVSIVVELRPSRSLDPVQDTVVLQKVFSDVNEAELKTTLGDTSLRLLTRGKVTMRIWSLSAPELVLQGAITSRATCNVFHSVLTASPEGPGNGVGPFGAGWGLIFLSNEGDFVYQIQLEELPSPVEEVLLQTATRRKVRNVEDITSALTRGWVNGTYSRPTYRDLDSLLRNRLLVSVVLENGVALEGTFETVSVTEALRSLHPALITSPSSWMAATAWVAVDDDCVMHYDVRLAGKDPAGGYDPMWSLQLRENDTSWDPRLDLVNVTLEHVLTGREVAAHTTLLTKVSLSRLFNGVSYLDLTVSSSSLSFVPSIRLTGHLTNVDVPQLCLLESDAGIGRGKRPEETVQVDAPCKNLICLDEEVKPVVSKKCIDDDKKVYEDGTTWKSPVNDCVRCMCTLGKIKCQNEPCPKPTCSDAVLLPGQCCPSCPGMVSGRRSESVCEMDGAFHIIGAFWHPFLAPNGFDKCVTCYCNVTHNLSPIVGCSRESCPRLHCLYSEASFEENSCCHKCPPVTPSPGAYRPATLKGMLNEGVMQKSHEQIRADVLSKGGCLERKKFLRPNGDVWYPKLSPNGVQRCVACSCKDSNISCVSMKCPKKECTKGRKCRKRKEKFRKSKNLSSFNDSLHRKSKNRRKERKRRLG